MNFALVIIFIMKKTIFLIVVLLPLVGMGQSKFNQFKAQKYVLEGVKDLYKENFEAAVGHFNQAVEINPANRDVYIFRANAFYQLDEYELALNDYGNAIRIQGEKAELFYRRGLTFERMGMYEEALQDYDYALDVDPRHVNAQRRKTRVIRRRNDAGEWDDWGFNDDNTDNNSSGSGDGEDLWREVLGETTDRSSASGNSNIPSDREGGFDFDNPTAQNSLRDVRVFRDDDLFVRKTPKDMKILQVEVAKYTTRLLIEYSNVSNTYQQLYLDPPSTRDALYLTDMRFKNKYHLTNIYRDSENRGNFRNNTIAPGATLNFYLEFERVPDDLEVFQIRTGDKEDTEKWNFYGVILKK